jgi:hypothetical protein
LFVFGSQVQAKIVRFDISQPLLKKFLFNEACQLMGHRQLLLVDAPNNYQLDCMGKIITALEFCSKKYPNDKRLLRGYIDQKKKQVVCQSGNNAILAMSCDSKHDKYCRKPKESCRRLQKVFAHRLNLDHQSVIDASKLRGDKRLNCYFSAAVDLNSLMDDPLKLPSR